ncbi:MAG: hypothetical protein QF516_03400, partial [Pirellulaceae bacterium]|nr:hypothetical protein [Pirellulaceae bacterium]
ERIVSSKGLLQLGSCNPPLAGMEWQDPIQCARRLSEASGSNSLLSQGETNRRCTPVAKMELHS